MMVRLAIAALLVLSVVLPSNSSVRAQQVQRIAAVVNDEVISIFDVTERISFLISSSGLPNTKEQQRALAPQVLRSLIDERLQEQEAKRLNIQVTKRDFERAVADIEQSNRVPPGRFEDFIKQQGVTFSAVKKQIEANLAWQKLLARRVLPTIEIGEEEIDAVIVRIDATRDAEQFRVSEILLIADDPGDQKQMRDLANRLVRQLRGGAEFAAIAQQFSKSATAATGGDIGWVQEGQLETSVIEILAQLPEGGVSDPVETPDGLVIFRLAARRKSAAPGEAEREIALRQILVQLARDASPADVEARMEQTRQAIATVQDCPAFVEAAKTLEVSQPAQPTRIKVGDLNEKLRNIVGNLTVGQPSDPLRTSVGIQVVMVCERTELSGPPRDEIRETLLRERMDLRARRYIRDLRRAAFIDIRI